MKRSLLILLGGVVTGVGALWTMQGLGYVGGSSMTGVTLWAVVGPVVAGLGVAMLYVAVRGSAGSKRR